MKFKKVKKLVRKELIKFYEEVYANEPNMLKDTLINIDEDFIKITSIMKLENIISNYGFDDPTDFIFESIIEF